jgi:hypothetical protein
VVAHREQYLLASLLTDVKFFVELWEELQKKAKKTDLEDNLAGPMSYTDVKNSTSASVGSDEDGGVFDETSTAFQKRRDHSELLMVEAIKYAFPGTLRPYFNKPQWLTVDEEADTGWFTSKLVIFTSNVLTLFKSPANPFFRLPLNWISLYRYYYTRIADYISFTDFG